MTNDVVKAGDPIYVFDKTTGNITSAGTAGAGTWVVTFVKDPAFVVTQIAPAAPAVSVAPNFTG